MLPPRLLSGGLFELPPGGKGPKQSIPGSRLSDRFFMQTALPRAGFGSSLNEPWASFADTQVSDVGMYNAYAMLLCSLSRNRAMSSPVSFVCGSKAHQETGLHGLALSSPLRWCGLGIRFSRLHRGVARLS